MTVKLNQLVIFALVGLALLMVGDKTLAASNIEVFIDLDGDGFDDNSSDVNKDGIPDLVCPVEAPTMLASTDDLFAAESQAPQPELKKTNAQHFGLRSFSVRALMSNRASASTGFEDIGSTAALGAEACPGGNCGI